MDRDDLVKKLGGSLIGVARKHQPDYSFAAYVHAGDRVDVYFFKGRMLTRQTALAEGSDTLSKFKALQGVTARKSGLFRKQPYKVALLAARARGNSVTFVPEYDRDTAFTPNSENPRKAFNDVMVDTFPDEAKALFAAPLPQGLSPSDIARSFMADRTQWNAYALAEADHGDSEADWNQRQTYDSLILRYCGPDKIYQGLSFGTSDTFHPDHTTILSEVIEADTARVETHFRNPEFEFINHKHQYAFHRAAADAPWQLQELWYHADLDGPVPCL